MIVAIDGPAASGKGTLGRRIAHILGYHYLDTGLLYRALACEMMRRGDDPTCSEASQKAANTLDIDQFSSSDLRRPGVGEIASIVAGDMAVRTILLAHQREFATREPGAVLDGRDIGTVVCPDAAVKIFVTASSDERARRRHRELLTVDGDIKYMDVLEEIERRDKRDRERAVAPLVIAEDAHLLETTDLDIETALHAALAIIREKIGQ